MWVSRRKQVRRNRTSKIPPDKVAFPPCLANRRRLALYEYNHCMRRLKLQMQVSLDLFISGTQSGMKWMIWPYTGPWTWDEELKEYFSEVTASNDTILLGWDMADGGYIDHWTSIAGQKDNSQSIFAANVVAAHKYVFSRKQRQSRWENTTTTTEDLATEVLRLKNLPGKDMIAYGGASFANALVRTGLIDEYHFIVNPAILGKGVSIFTKIDDILRLIPVSARVYPCGITVLVYLNK
jgi:dihydrofolate reductase